MVEVLSASAEGEFGLASGTTLDGTGSNTRLRGSVVMAGASGKKIDVNVASGKNSRDMWFSAIMSLEQNTGPVNGTMQDFFKVTDTGSVTLFSIKAEGTTNIDQTYFKIRTADGSGGLTAEAEIYVGGRESTFRRYAVHLVITTTTITDDTLTTTFYLAGRKRFTRTLVAGSAWDLPDRLELTPKGDSAADDGQVWVQDVIVTDGISPNTMLLTSMYPNAAGNYSAWTNTYTNVDESGYDPADVISATAVNDRESWALGDDGFSLDRLPVVEFRVNPVMQLSGGSITDFSAFLRISATDYGSGGLGATTSISTLSYAWLLDPNTAAVWTKTALDALEFGVKAD